MTQPDSDLDWLVADTRNAARDFADQLRSIGDMSTPVPNLNWDVGELAAHLISLPKLYHDQNSAGSYERPTDFARFADDARSHITARRARELCELLIEQTEVLIAECAPNPDVPRILYDRETNGRNLLAGMLTELKLHGMDISRITGAEVELTRRQAVAGLRQAMAVAPAMIDQAKARRLDGIYHLRFRGGDDYTYVINDGLLTASLGKPDRADAHLNADPVSFMLLSLGRMSQVKAGLLGKVVVYGRKPWKLARLGSIVVDGV